MRKAGSRGDSLKDISGQRDEAGFEKEKASMERVGIGQGGLRGRENVSAGAEWQGEATPMMVDDDGWAVMVDGPGWDGLAPPSDAGLR